MTQSKLSRAALLSALLGAAVAAQTAQAAEVKGPTERCYGVAKVGENDCAAADGSHSCHTKAKGDHNGQDFKLVPKGTCESMKGSPKPFAGDNPKMKDTKEG